MLRGLSASCLAALTLVACSSWHPPAPPPERVPIPPGPDDAFAHPLPKARPQTTGEKFAALRDKILDDWLYDDPSMGRTLGLHAYDGKVGAFSAATIEARS